MTSTATSLIKSEAKRLGFSHTGISSACFLEQEAPRLEKWLKNNMHGNMSYMERNFDKRLDPRLLVDGAKSVVSFVLNYFPEAKQIDPEAPKISRYAYGKDYHQVIKEKLFQLLNFIRENIGEVNGRAFVDSAPVLDKAWAQKSGLGWIGKNSNLINPKNGSYFFIAELILDIELEPDLPITDYCGTCTKCIDACPTQAIIKPYVVDGSKCISYFTIELKDAFPESLKNTFDDWVFGCDVCQEVCPWNRFSKPTQESAFHPREGLLEMSKSDWYEITKDVFNKVFKDSAVQRTGFEGLKRNLEFLKNQ
ncbi:MAG: tRNA epoxyqueuosine(34) reductase QueG [Bacteroidetes bacterium]|nr:tRNA epoxyqueuosine(34) reductase QueG [Bacteroidota bacterium]